LGLLLLLMVMMVVVVLAAMVQLLGCPPGPLQLVLPS
jgi:hypothetical protein